MGNALTVTTVAVLVAEQPLASVTVTVGEDVVETVIEDVVSPVLQEYDVPALAVKTTLPPEQKVVAPPAVITGMFKAATVTGRLIVFVQPFAAVKVKV